MNTRDIMKNFKVPFSDEEIVSETPMTAGHINNTRLITLPSGKYILQEINASVFPDIDRLQDNLLNIKKCFENCNTQDISIPEYIETASGDLILFSDGHAFRSYQYIEETNAEDMDVSARIRICAFAFGRFIRIIDGCRLNETLHGYHDLVHYASLYHKALAAQTDKESCSDLINSLAEIEDTISDSFPYTIPLRNIHGDASVKNILIPSDPGCAPTIIDLDTSFPGYAASDFGDIVRSSLDLIRKNNKKKCLDDETVIQTINDITAGFLRGTGDLLSDKEIHSLVPGIIRADCELAMRYMTDALSQGSYFGKTPAECLSRTSELIDDAKQIIRIRERLIPSDHI